MHGDPTFVDKTDCTLNRIRSDHLHMLFVTNLVHGLLYTRHQRSPFHHIDSCTTTTVARHPRTTIPIIHCTDDTHTADCTNHAHTWELSHNHTPYINPGLPFTDRWVLFRDGRYLIVCNIPVKILLTIRISLPAIITIKSSCWHISVCNSAERHRGRQKWNWGRVYR